MMVVVHTALSDYVAVVISIYLTMVLIVMDDVGISITIDSSHAIVVLIVFGARGGRGQNKRSGCQSTKECLFHGRFWRTQAVVYSIKYD